MAYWPLCEARLLQKRSAVSAANATSVLLGAGPPQGKVWILLGVGYYPSVAETRSVGFEKQDGTNTFALNNPVSMLLNPAVATCIEQGMECMLFPGELLGVKRDVATAGSTMTLVIQFVEIDLPLYVYEEPQIVKRTQRALSSIRQRLGGGGGTGSGPGSSPGTPAGSGTSGPPAY